MNCGLVVTGVRTIKSGELNAVYRLTYGYYVAQREGPLCL
jgi:hypothetical protein